VRGYLIPDENPLPYSIVLGSFRDPESAAKGRDALRRAGFDAYLVPVELGDLGRWTRVMVGQFHDEAEARARLDAIVAGSDVREGRIVESSWAYLMGMYASEEDADAARAELEAVGLDPYLLQPPAEERLFAVYVGAFESDGQAGPLGERLRALGLDGELVRRSGTGL
jgi:cell division septation protein DedD